MRARESWSSRRPQRADTKAFTGTLVRHAIPPFLPFGQQPLPALSGRAADGAPSFVPKWWSIWRARQDSNLQPQASEDNALLR
jgi:hypothetical protein